MDRAESDANPDFMAWLFDAAETHDPTLSLIAMGYAGKTVGPSGKWGELAGPILKRYQACGDINQLPERDIEVLIEWYGYQQKKRSDKQRNQQAQAAHERAEKRRKQHLQRQVRERLKSPYRTNLSRCAWSAPSRAKKSKAKSYAQQVAAHG